MISSAGSEHYLDKVGVTGSNPVSPTFSFPITIFGLSGGAFNSVSEAYEAALVKAGKADVIYIGGSTFTVAEII